MRALIVPFLLVVAQPQLQKVPLALTPALSVTTTRPRVDASTGFKLASSALGVTWDFGDETPPQTGGSAISHVYRTAGTFTVKASAGGNTFQQSVTVVEPRRLIVTPSAPKPGKATALKLEEAFGKTLQWTFGDGTAPVNGGVSVSHTFIKEGSYTVAVKDTGTEFHREFKLNVPVGLQGPGAPFSISYLALRWEDGATERSVKQGEKGLVAFADLKFEGTGQFQAEWLVDGQVQRAVSQQLGFAKLTTLRSGQTIGSPLSTRIGTTARDGRHTLATVVPGEFEIALPTNVAGEHVVTLKVLQPKLAFQVPVIRYFVKLGSEAQGPVVQGITPPNAKPGDEVELILTGTGFTADMALNLGKDVGVLGAPQILSPEKAVVKVFIAPTAQPGKRLFQARKPGGSLAGTAHLEIVSGVKLAGGLAAKPGVLGNLAPAPATPPPPAPGAQPMQGNLPGGKPAVALKGALAEPVKPAGLALQKIDDKGKKPLGGILAPAGFKATKVDLGKVSKSGSNFSKFAPPSGGKGLGMVVDASAAKRKDKVLACTEGQKLKLSKITLATPSFSLIGVNTSGEFQSDNLPVLRDSTQFTWKEKNPGTSEYYELRFYAAKNASLLKTVRIPGNRSSYEVTPAFVQELGRLYNVSGLDAVKGLLST
ncbi:MAG: PKD domain-containing protein, partial [Holophaga sp.]